MIEYEGESIKSRRVVVRLKEPTRDGDSEVAVFSNLRHDAVHLQEQGERLRDNTIWCIAISPAGQTLANVWLVSIRVLRDRFNSRVKLLNSRTMGALFSVVGFFNKMSFLLYRGKGDKKDMGEVFVIHLGLLYFRLHLCVISCTTFCKFTKRIGQIITQTL